MPRVAINRPAYLTNDLYAYLIGQMKVRGITQQSLGEQLGLSQQVVSGKLKKKQLSTQELIIVLDILEVDGGMLAHLMGRS